MNHTNYTSETIRLDPSSSGTKETEKNIHLQSPAITNNANHQKKKISSFQIISIRPTSRSSNDADPTYDSDVEDTSDILDSSKINTDAEQETPSCSEDYPKSEEVFVGASPIITNTSQYGISTLIHSGTEDGLLTARLPQGVTVNVTEGGLALAKANGGIDDLHNWQNRFKIVKISSNEKFRKGRWVCFDFNDSPAVSASESKMEGTHILPENTVVIPTSDPNMPGFLQVPVPIISGELAQPLTPIAVQYPTGEPIVQGTIPMTSNICYRDNKSSLNCDRLAQQPHFFQPSAQQIHNYSTHDTNSQSYSLAALNSSSTQTSHSSMSSQSCLPSTGNISKESVASSQLASNSATNILPQPDNSMKQAPIPTTFINPVLSHSITQASSDCNYSETNSSCNISDSVPPVQGQHQPSLSGVHHPGSQQMPGTQLNMTPILSANIPTTSSIVSTAPIATPGHNLIQSGVFSQGEVASTQGNTSNIAATTGLSGLLVPGQPSISVAQILQAQGIGISFSQTSSSQVLSALEAVANRNIDSVSSNSSVPVSGEEGESALVKAAPAGSEGEASADLLPVLSPLSPSPVTPMMLSPVSTPPLYGSLLFDYPSAAALSFRGAEDGSTTPRSASSTSAVAIDNKIEQAMDLVKSHLMFAVREEVEVLKEKILELMDQISSLECENTLLRQYAPPEALQQIQPSLQQQQQPGNLSQQQIVQPPHHGGSS